MNQKQRKLINNYFLMTSTDVLTIILAIGILILMIYWFKTRSKHILTIIKYYSLLFTTSILHYIQLVYPINPSLSGGIRATLLMINGVAIYRLWMLIKD